MHIGEMLKNTGRGLICLGGVCLFAAAIIGTLVADILIIIAASKSNNSGFLTGLLLGFLFGSRHDYSHSQASGLAVFMVSSLIMTAIGFGLALHFALPTLAFFLAAIWVGSTLVTLLGMGLEAAGDRILKEEYSTGRNTSYGNYPSPYSTPALGVVVEGRPSSHTVHRHPCPPLYPTSSLNGTQPPRPGPRF